MSSVLERHVRNRLIFPAITSMIICLLYDTDNWIYRLFLAGIFLWFSLKEGRFIAYFCIVGSIMVSVSYKLQEYSFLEEKETAAQVTLSTDTIRANGSFLTMEGRLSESKQKVLLSYQVNTEEELKTWLGFRGKGIELTAEGEFISPEKSEILILLTKKLTSGTIESLVDSKFKGSKKSPYKIIGEIGSREKEALLFLLSNLNFRKKQVYISILYYGAIKIQVSENQKKFLGRVVCCIYSAYRDYTSNFI